MFFRSLFDASDDLTIPYFLNVSRCIPAIPGWKVGLPFFSGLNNQQILTICHLLDRRFLLPDVTVVREGDGGDFMVVLNCGKASHEIACSTCSMVMEKIKNIYIHDCKWM